MKPVMVVLVVGACGGGGCGGGHVSDDGPTTCTRQAPPGDHVRHIVVSHSDGNVDPSGEYEVLDVSATGEISRPGRTFTMRANEQRPIRFTPDGKIGISIQVDGTLGIFELADDGTPTVIDPAFAPAPNIIDVVMAGDHAYLEASTTYPDVAMFRLDFACDGTPMLGDRVLDDGAYGKVTMLPGGDRAIVEIGGGDQPVHIQLRDLQAATLLDDVTLFGDVVGDATIYAGIAAATVTEAGRYLAAEGRNPLRGSQRFAIVEIDADAIVVSSMLTDVVEDPWAIVASPFGNVAVAVDGVGPSVHVLDDSGTGLTVRGDLDFVSPRPGVLTDTVHIDAGTLSGFVLMNEEAGIRTVEMTADGAVIDHGAFTLGDSGDGTSTIGSLGITP